MTTPAIQRKLHELKAEKIDATLELRQCEALRKRLGGRILALSKRLQKIHEDCKMLTEMSKENAKKRTRINITKQKEQ